MVHPGHYVSLPTSLSLSAAGQHAARLQTSHHAAPPPSVSVVSSSSSSSTVRSATCAVQSQLTAVTTSHTATASAHGVYLSPPTNTSTSLSPGLPPPSLTRTAAVDRKLDCRPGNSVLTSFTCHGPITRTLSPAVKASNGADAASVNVCKVEPAVFDREMKYELVWRTHWTTNRSLRLDEVRATDWTELCSFVTSRMPEQLMIVAVPCWRCLS